MQGKISDFSIPDIFQLIASQGKSGSLSIRWGERETVFLFSEGLIVDVQPDRRIPSGMLGAMLVDAGLITGQQLRKILMTQEKGGKKLGEALMEKDMISGETLARYLSLQIKESLFEILPLKEGEYRFEGFAVRPPAWMIVPVRADVLMMEGMQYLDEYAIYREKFPPGDFRAIRIPGEKVDPDALSEEEQRVWKGLEFSSEPQRIFRKACLTWFEGVKGLWSLLDRGLVEISAPEEKQVDPERVFREEKARIRNIGFLRAAAWTVAALSAAAWVYSLLLSPGATDT
ncbi:MAG: DUF4388 domain-containing protein, partial [Deltaproteobacteria bacterium]|nr:DUF4388 domain-containing protein [Deltaproteobacteria bacterium]